MYVMFRLLIPDKNNPSYCVLTGRNLGCIVLRVYVRCTCVCYVYIHIYIYIYIHIHMYMYYDSKSQYRILEYHIKSQYSILHMNIYLYIYIYTHTYITIYIYIYICRERERQREREICIICHLAYVHTVHTSSGAPRAGSAPCGAPMPIYDIIPYLARIRLSII